MQKKQLSALKEERPHGTRTFPCAIYQTRALGKGSMFKHHWHEEVEILYFYGGTFRLEINMESFLVKSECLYFINPGELHSIICEESGSIGEDAIVFDPAILSFDSYDTTQMKLIHPIRNGQMLFPRCILPSHPAFAPIRDAFKAVMYAFGEQVLQELPYKDGAVTDDLTTQLYVKSSLLRIFAILSASTLFTPTEKIQDKRVEAIKAVITFIKENYSEKIYIRDLAGLLSMNEQYFCRFFKKAIGRSPIDYLNEYRVRQAVRLLEETNLPVTEICLECGFNNMGNFLKEFKKYMKITPLQYRKHFLALP